MKYEIIQADVLEWAKTYSGPPFSAMLCDPPYHLLSKTRGNSQRNPGAGPFGRHTLDNKPSPGFMGKTWDGSEEIAFKPETWEILGKHLHPGAFMMCFGVFRR